MRDRSEKERWHSFSTFLILLKPSLSIWQRESSLRTVLQSPALPPALAQPSASPLPLCRRRSTRCHTSTPFLSLHQSLCCWRHVPWTAAWHPSGAFLTLRCAAGSPVGTAKLWAEQARVGEVPAAVLPPSQDQNQGKVVQKQGEEEGHQQ